MRRSTREIYFSVDVEADGRVPGPSSMVSLGACAAAVRDGDGAVGVLDPTIDTFYRELRPISATWDAEALAVSGLTRAHLEEHGEPPERAIASFAEWVDSVARTHRAKP